MVLGLFRSKKKKEADAARAVDAERQAEQAARADAAAQEAKKAITAAPQEHSVKDMFGYTLRNDTIEPYDDADESVKSDDKTVGAHENTNTTPDKKLESSEVSSVRDEALNVKDIKKDSLIGRLRKGLGKSSSQLGDGITGIFTKSTLDDGALEELEDVLIMSDMGATPAMKLSAMLGKEKFDKKVAPDAVKIVLAGYITDMLAPVQQPIALQPAGNLTVIMVVGVNGNGKTTTIGKLAMRYKQDGKKVMLAAADTFRAAAVEQLGVWAKRANVPCITGAHEADPSSVAYQAVERAQKEHVDVLLIDTAGRLQNKQNLMEELGKMTRVIKKCLPDAPHYTMMVLDGTTGQNALSQAKTFNDYVPLTGFAITKLDGTAKGGMVVALADMFGLPVHYVGVGEQIDDLQDFNAQYYAQSLIGISHT